MRHSFSPISEPAARSLLESCVLLLNSPARSCPSAMMIAPVRVDELDHRLRLVLLLHVPHRIAQDQPALGIGVDHLDGLPDMRSTRRPAAARCLRHVLDQRADAHDIHPRLAAASSRIAPVTAAGGMEEMKMDMCGAAAVTGAMRLLAARKARVNVVGICALVENMPDGNAQRPGDVWTSMSGQTVEVINTDAEGRLILCDAMWHVQNKYKPQAMVELST